MSEYVDPWADEIEEENRETRMPLVPITEGLSEGGQRVEEPDPGHKPVSAAQPPSESPGLSTEEGSSVAAGDGRSDRPAPRAVPRAPAPSSAESPGGSGAAGVAAPPVDDRAQVFLDRASAPGKTKRKRAGLCVHRVPPASFCKRCD